MPTNEQHDLPAEAVPPDEAAQRAAAEAARARIWESPIGTGEPIAFDPAIHKPPMSQEEIEAVLGKDDN